MSIDYKHLSPEQRESLREAESGVEPPPTCRTCPMYESNECRVNPPKVQRPGDKGYFPEMPEHEFCGRHPDLKNQEGSFTHSLSLIAHYLSDISERLQRLEDFHRGR